MPPTIDSPTNTDSSATTDSQNTSSVSDNNSVKATNPTSGQTALHVSTTPVSEGANSVTGSRNTKPSSISPPIKTNPPPLPSVNSSTSSNAARNTNPYLSNQNNGSSNSNDGYRALLNRLTMGLIDWLKFHPNVTSVKVSDFKRAEKSDFSNWEQKHMCILPDDLKAFYSTLNGINLSWAISMTNLTPGGLNLNQGEGRQVAAGSEKDQVQVGLINVNPLSKLTRVAGTYEAGDYGISLADIDSDEDYSPLTDPKDSLPNSSTFVKPRCPKFNERSRIFELDYVEKLKARVCLVYKNTRNEMPAGPNPVIWLLDRSLTWHFIANDFTTFFRLMIVHLGLPEWHFLFSNIPVSNKARQWFNFFAPTRLLLSSHHQHIGDSYSSTTESEERNPNAVFETPLVQNKFDAGKVFKAKSVRMGTKTNSGNSTSGTSQAQSNQKKKPDPKANSQSTTLASGTTNSSAKGASNQGQSGAQRAASAGNSRRS